MLVAASPCLHSSWPLASGSSWAARASASMCSLDSSRKTGAFRMSAHSSGSGGDGGSRSLVAKKRFSTHQTAPPSIAVTVVVRGCEK